MKDYIVKATAADNQIRAYAATTKELVDTTDLVYGQERGIKALEFGTDIDAACGQLRAKVEGE